MPKLRIHNSSLLDVPDKRWATEDGWDVTQPPTVEVEDSDGNLVGVEVTDYGFLVTVVKGDEVHSVSEIVVR